MEAEEPYEYEVDLRDYIHVIWKEKWLILGIFLLAVALAAIFSFTRPASYETEASLYVNPYYESSPVVIGANFPTKLDPDLYRELAGAEKLYMELSEKLSKNWKEDNVTPNSLKGKSSFEIKEDELVIDITKDGEGQVEIKKATLVKLTVNGQDPQMVKEIANGWAKLFKKRIEEFVSDNFTSSIESLKGQFQTVKTDLRAEEERELNYRKHLNTLTSRLKGLERKQERLTEELEEKRSRQIALRAKTKNLKSRLKEVPKYLKLERSIPTESILKYLGENPTEKKLKKLSTLKVYDQDKNDLYFSLKKELSLAEAELDSLKQQIPDLEKEISRLEGEIEELRNKTEELKLNLKRHDRKITRLEKLNNRLAKRIEEISVARKGSEETISLLQEAVAPQEAQPTNTKQNVAVAGVLGLFIGILGAFFKNYMEGYEE